MKQQLIQEAKRFQKLAGLIKENEVTNTPVIQGLEKKAFDFFNSPKVVALLKKELDKLSPEKKAELANTSIQEGEANDFSSFKSTVEKVIDDASLNEEYDDMHDLLRGKIGGYEPGEEPTSVDKTVGNILTTLGVTNIMSMGFLPALTAMAIDEFGGTNIINTVSQAIGSGSVAAGLSVLGGLIGGGILWKIGKILKNERTTGETPLFEIESVVNKALTKFRLNEAEVSSMGNIVSKIDQNLDKVESLPTIQQAADKIMNDPKLLQQFQQGLSKMGVSIDLMKEGEGEDISTSDISKIVNALSKNTDRLKEAEMAPLPPEESEEERQARYMKQYPNAKKYEDEGQYAPIIFGVGLTSPYWLQLFSPELLSKVGSMIGTQAAGGGLLIAGIATAIAAIATKIIHSIPKYKVKKLQQESINIESVVNEALATHRKKKLNEAEEQIDPVAEKDAEQGLKQALAILNAGISTLKPSPKDGELDESLTLGLIAGAPGLVSLLGKATNGIASLFQKDKKKGTVVGNALKHWGHKLEENYITVIGTILLKTFPSAYSGQDIHDKTTALYDAAHGIYATMLAAAAISSGLGAAEAHSTISAGLEGGLSAFKSSEVVALAQKIAAA
jgi:hypothetical protein